MTMDLEQDDPGSSYTFKIVEEEDDAVAGGVKTGAAAANDGGAASQLFNLAAPAPLVEYFDERGNNVTPLPLHSLDREDQEQASISRTRTIVL